MSKIITLDSLEAYDTNIKKYIVGGEGSTTKDDEISNKSTWSSEKINTELNKKINSDILSPVATSGSYNDLDGAPEILENLNDVENNTEAGKVVDALAIKQLKKSVADGKASIASALTNNGANTANDATFSEIASNVNSMATGQYDAGQKSVTPSASSTSVGYDGSVTVSNPYDTSKKVTITGPAAVSISTISGGVASNAAHPASISVTATGSNSATKTQTLYADATSQYNAGSSAAKTSYEPKSSTLSNAGALIVKNAAGTSIHTNTFTNSYDAGVTAGKAAITGGTQTKLTQGSWSSNKMTVTASAGYNSSDLTTSVDASSIRTAGQNDVKNSPNSYSLYTSTQYNNALASVPSGYVKPSGEKSIFSNGTYDVTNWSSIAVNIPTAKKYRAISSSTSYGGNVTHWISEAVFPITIDDRKTIVSLSIIPYNSISKPSSSDVWHLISWNLRDSSTSYSGHSVLDGNYYRGLIGDAEYITRDGSVKNCTAELAFRGSFLDHIEVDFVTPKSDSFLRFDDSYSYEINLVIVE